MIPKKAWNVAKAQLKDEIPKAAYEEHLADAELEDFDPETGTVTTSVPTEVSRAWLEDRLTSKLSRMLTGILNRRVTVRFVAPEANPNDPNNAWPQVLAQLQREIPQQEFDTWVRDSQLLRLEDGVAEIGVPSASARDWLESRLSSRIAYLLTSLTNQTVEVRFVSSENVSAPDENDIVVKAAPYQTIYDRLVNPHRRVIVPGYFRKHLAEIGVKLAWIYVALREVTYMQGGRSGTRSVRVAAKTVAALSGISLRTFTRLRANPKTFEALQGLVTPLDDGPAWQAVDGKVHQMPSRYEVAMTLPLTATDAASLRKWLVENAEVFGGPEAVLRAACETPLEQLLPTDAGPQDGIARQSVQDIVLDLFGSLLPEGKLLALASQLQNHIMPARDTIHISLFFLERVLPYLGPGPAWLLTLLRDRCWVNPDTGEARTTVRVAGGYAEMAAWLGLKRPKTIWEWAQPGKPLSLYLAIKNDRFWTFRDVDVLMEEIPPWLLEIAADGERWSEFSGWMQAVLDGDETCQEQPQAVDGANDMQGMVRLTRMDWHSLQPESVTPQWIKLVQALGANDTGVRRE